MPNKYEREIEEILRNMDRGDQGPTLGDRIRAFNQPAQRVRPPRTHWHLRIGGKPEERLLVLGILLALIGAGIAFYFGRPQDTVWAYVTGILGVAALAVLLCGLFLGWRRSFGHTSSPSTWRGQHIRRPRTFRPFTAIATQMRIIQLKWRYWRTRGR